MFSVMTITDGHTDLMPRQINCARCGITFGCTRDGACWCMDEAFTLPMPIDGGDCLCPACLRTAAEITAARKALG